MLKNAMQFDEASSRKTEKLKELGKKYMVQAKKLREKTKRLKRKVHCIPYNV